MRYPVLASRGCEADHGLLYVVFGEFAFSLADQIDDSLMCIDILPPGGRSFAAHADSYPHKSKKWVKDFLGIIEEMRITGDPAQLQVKAEITVGERFTVTRFGCIAHFLHDGLQSSHICTGSCRKVTCHSFQAGPNLVELNNIFPI